MTSALSFGFRRPLSLALRGLILRRFSSSSNPLHCFAEEDKHDGTEKRDPPHHNRPTFIHPAAIVHPEAILGQGVSIGPFCTIGPSAKVGNACQLYPGSHVFGNTELGDNCVLMVGAVVGDDLPGHTVIGCNNTIGHHAVVGAKCQDMKYKDHAHTAGAIVVHQFCHIGSFSFIGGGSVVSQDIPKYMMVSGERAQLRGLNLEGLRRHGFSVAEIRSLRAAYRKIFMPINANLGGVEDRMVQVEQDEELVLVPTVRSMLQSIRDSFAEDRRGICKFRSWIET
ncbi:probable acyl-[acyl-carrier-protein]--UDP-N-acetylglucosamine O-acyltransferase, mitochondrial isoform X2 [Coffea eugenioides]|uniref:probable acyl-[acyl-carrier-protein]--UDP-N-acetylglucosamine O-acyltransferase, mitochondrial isoform X2 n=1 Tax=Coffea eugenioides TaxID=49369 RepID=UPI000F604A31|nr:probable acyl-[acyl-carrier-protein]--UDP-N-acetylglucosamine O-acyltransferase, mitochondrial isoform X2 [Coffea eugenioides]